MSSRNSTPFAKKDAWSLISIIVISMSVFNFALQYTSTINPDLFDMIVSSTKVDRFAEALGYHSPVAVTGTYSMYEDQVGTFDVLDNDYDNDYETNSGNSNNSNKNGLWIANNNQISGITGDNSASITVNPTPTSNNSTSGAWQNLIPTNGVVNVDTTQNFHGSAGFTYQVCDNGIATAVNSSCSTIGNTVNVFASNDRPIVNGFNVTTNQNTVYNFTPTQFTSNFQDPDQVFLNSNPSAIPSANEGYTLEYIVITQLPTNGVLKKGNTTLTGTPTVTKTEFASLSYVPNNGYSGADSFKYQGNDGYVFIFPDEVNLSTQEVITEQESSSVAATVGITINPQNQPLPPVLTTQDLVVKRGQSKSFQALVPSQTLPQTITGLTVAGLPQFCTQSTAGVSGNVITCSAPINTPLGQTTFTATATNSSNLTTTTNYNVTVIDYVQPNIVLTSDTPNVEINKKLCVLGTVTNPNDFDLVNVVVNLTTDINKAPFVDNSSVFVSGGEGGSVTQTSANASYTIPLLVAGGSASVQTCAIPKIIDISYIDGKTFVTGSDKISQDNVELNPPATPEIKKSTLVRTGGNTGTIVALTVFEGLLTALIWTYYKMTRKNKSKE
jgi:Bacterial Ig domain